MWLLKMLSVGDCVLVISYFDENSNVSLLRSKSGVIRMIDSYSSSAGVEFNFRVAGGNNLGGLCPANYGMFIKLKNLRKLFKVSLLLDRFKGFIPGNKSEGHTLNSLR